MKSAAHFFDRLEDGVRGWLSHRPILYGLVGGVGVVLFWRGVWHTADFISLVVFLWQNGSSTTDLSGLYDGLASFATGSLLLLASGVWVSGFIGNEVIISGLRGDKKLAEKTEAEVETETEAIADIRRQLARISRDSMHLNKNLPRQKRKHEQSRRGIA